MKKDQWGNDIFHTVFLALILFFSAPVFLGVGETEKVAGGEEAVIFNPRPKDHSLLKGRLETLGKMFKVSVDLPLCGELIEAPAAFDRFPFIHSPSS